MLKNGGLGPNFTNAPCLPENNVCSKGASSARFNVLNITENIVVIIYGMANFSIGLANDSSRKYVFININKNKRAKLTVIT